MVTFWVTILVLSMLLYVLLDGFDLGVGILFGVISGDTERRTMMSAVAPVWDDNETWLVVTAVVLWGAFPIVYSILLSAFYLPLFLMLAGLILRGVAFEYRAKTQRLRWIWDSAFAGGSLVAAFVQGLTVGALVEGLPVAGTLYTGGAFGWLSPFALLCGVGLCIGYALLGACCLLRFSWEGQSRCWRLLARNGCRLTRLTAAAASPDFRDSSTDFRKPSTAHRYFFAAGCALSLSGAHHRVRSRGRAPSSPRFGTASTATAS
jgi:cytochrome d oxidase subunit CydB